MTDPATTSVLLCVQLRTRHDAEAFWAAIREFNERRLAIAAYSISVETLRSDTPDGLTELSLKSEDLTLHAFARGWLAARAHDASPWHQPN